MLGVKRLCIVLFLLSIVGCGNVTKKQMDACATLCNPNEGVKHITVDSDLVNECHCVNGMMIPLYMTTVTKYTTKRNNE